MSLRTCGKASRRMELRPDSLCISPLCRACIALPAASKYARAASASRLRGSLLSENTVERGFTLSSRGSRPAADPTNASP